MGKKGKKKGKKKTNATESQLPDKNPPTEKSNQQTIIPWIWSWGAVGAAVGILSGGGLTFMTSGWPYIADLFFLVSGILFLVKFLTSEILGKHERKRIIQRRAIFCTLVIVAGSILGNHYLNYKKHTRGFVQIDKPHIVETPEYSTLGIGKQLAFNIVMTNTTSERLFKIAGHAKIYIIEQPDAYSDKKIVESSRNEQKAFNQKYESGEIAGRSEMGKSNIWGTVWTGPLSEKQCRGLLDGSTRIYIVSWGAWRDEEDKVDTAFSCRWLQALPQKNLGVYSTGDLVWHSCQ